MGIICKAVVLMILLASVSAPLSLINPDSAGASDGFPRGQDTPEGVATDFARAFIQQDDALYRRICVRPHGAAKIRSQYLKFINGTSEALSGAKKNGVPSPNDPSKIVRVFGARHFSRNGPASYGYASFDFQEVMFVDVEVVLRNGSNYVNRTMVIKDRDGRWFVHPLPRIQPLLSYGLVQESPSVKVFSTGNTRN